MEKEFELQEGIAFMIEKSKQPEVRQVSTKEMIEAIRIAEKREIAWTTRQL